MSNSNKDLEPNKDLQQNNEDTSQSMEKKTISDRIQYIIGALSGLVTGIAIYLSNDKFDVRDELISKILDYAFLIVFVLFMVLTRKYENDNNVSLKKTKTAYMLAMGVVIIVFLIMALTTPR